MCNPPEATRHHNRIKLLILLPLRAIYFRTFQCEIPCSRKPGDYNGTIVFEIDIMKTGVAISFHSIPFFPPFFQKQKSGRKQQFQNCYPEIVHNFYKEILCTMLQKMQAQKIQFVLYVRKYIQRTFIFVLTCILYDRK